jgi:hypothetical protein
MGIRLKPSGNLTTKGGIAIKKSGRTQERRTGCTRYLAIPQFRSAALFEAIAVVAGLDDFASVREPIEQSGGHLGVTEHGAPFAEGQV